MLILLITYGLFDGLSMDYLWISYGFPMSIMDFPIGGLWLFALANETQAEPAVPW